MDKLNVLPGIQPTKNTKYLVFDLAGCVTEHSADTVSI